MEKKKDLRQSLLAKCVALLLVFTAGAGAVLGTFAVTLISSGYGVANEFQDDPMGKEALNRAMIDAVYYVRAVNGSYSSYYYQTELERAGGFAALVYEGESAGGTPLGGWGEVPENYMCRLEKTVKTGDTEYYTVVGYLTNIYPNGSNFSIRYGIYNTLHSLSFSATMLLTVILYIVALAALTFLFCAAGHKAGREGISLNWQDRVPLDLYLCLACLLFCLAILPAMVAMDGMPMALEIAICCLSALGCTAIALATLLTLVTRFKKGKWWRNTICWRLCRWTARTWKRFWRALTELVSILPMTWRVILAALGCLGFQSVMVLLFFVFDGSLLIFLVTVLLDMVLLAGAAWLTIQLQRVRDMGSALAAGDLEAQLDTEKMYFDVKHHAEDLNAIGVGMNKAVEQRLKSERLKTELITNVSHDIKTPLTSIVNYVDLLKKEDLSPAAGEYVAVLDRQANRLRKLTEDLVEASKASTGNMAVNLEPIVVNEIIHQAIGDYDEKLAAGKLDVIVNTYEGNVMALADGRLLWRVLDNLLSNVCKYAMAGTRVYVDLSARDGKVLLSMKNISRDPLNVSADELMERFVRGDASRHTEGSGLGLNIARSLMDLMGGGFSLSVDGDLFKAELTLRA
ncbi:MAG: HAMP domain-containing histidine kinase [Oscillibacter sp.]|nr:HAMP domain-containing histidine kinase [Oscillibacter sp.]